MCRENATWGAPRIQSKLKLLGHDVAETTVAKYMVCDRKPVQSKYSAELQLLIPIEVTNGLQNPISAGFQTGLRLTEQIQRKNA